MHHHVKHRVRVRGKMAIVLERNAIDAAPERSEHTIWSTFIEAHWKFFAASDFFATEGWTRKGPITHYVQFVIGLAGRVVRFAGITTRPDEVWLLQIAGNIVDEDSGALAGKKYLILDRDMKYTERFRTFVEGNGTEAA